jgi:hypothetical protein
MVTKNDRRIKLEILPPRLLLQHQNWVCISGQQSAPKEKASNHEP